MVVKCPNCGKENKNTNIKCEFCSTQLLDENKPQNVIVLSPKQSGCFLNIISAIIYVPWIICGLSFIVFGIFGMISEHNKENKFEKTTAIFKECINCYYDNDIEFCEGVYEYEVNGNSYTASTSWLRPCEYQQGTETFYYNKNNPSETIMDISEIEEEGSWIVIIVTGFIMVVILIIKMISSKKKLKELNGNNNCLNNSKL